VIEAGGFPTAPSAADGPVIQPLPAVPSRAGTTPGCRAWSCWPAFARPADDPCVLFTYTNPAQPGHGKLLSPGRRPPVRRPGEWPDLPRGGRAAFTDRHRRRARSGCLLVAPTTPACPHGRIAAASRWLHLSGSVSPGLRACASNSKSAWRVGEPTQGPGAHTGGRLVFGISGPDQAPPRSAPMGGDGADRWQCPRQTEMAAASAAGR